MRMKASGAKSGTMLGKAKFGLFLNRNLTDHVFVYRKNNLDVEFPIEADEIRQKLQDPELSKRDLNAILDAILNDDKDGVSDKGKDLINLCFDLVLKNT